MRVDFTRAIDRVLSEDPRSLLVTGDLGYNAFEGIASRHTARFINAGVAEQNMIGAAAGLAMAGLRPWVYSIVPFLVLRPLEQIRNDLCLHALSVRLVGNGGGFTYGIMGSTHHGLEDLGILKGLPNMKLFFPCSGDQVEAAVRAMAACEGPCYLRLAVPAHAAASGPLQEDPRTLTRHYCEGSAATVVAVGHAAGTVLAAVGSDRIDADVWTVSRFPFDLETDARLLESARRTGRVLIVDEHYAPGSIGESLAARLAAEGGIRTRLLAARYSKEQKYGGSRFHLEQAGIGPRDILTAFKEAASK